VAHATTALEDIESDFQSWCATQHTTFNAELKLLEKKLRDAEPENQLNLATENLLLQRIMKKGLEGLEHMKTKFESMQTVFNEIPEVSLQIGVETCEKRGSLTDWEKGFREQATTAQDFKGKGSFLMDRVSTDLTQMRDITDHLDVRAYIKDASLFQKQVLPQFKTVLTVLENHGENVDTI